MGGNPFGCRLLEAYELAGGPGVGRGETDVLGDPLGGTIRAARLDDHGGATANEAHGARELVDRI